MHAVLRDTITAFSHSIRRIRIISLFLRLRLLCLFHSPLLFVTSNGPSVCSQSRTQCTHYNRNTYCITRKYWLTPVIQWIQWHFKISSNSHTAVHIFLINQSIFPLDFTLMCFPLVQWCTLTCILYCHCRAKGTMLGSAKARVWLNASEEA